MLVRGPQGKRGANPHLLRPHPLPRTLATAPAHLPLTLEGGCGCPPGHAPQPGTAPGTVLLPHHHPHKAGVRGGCLPHPPAGYVHARVGTALPAAFATSAVVTFWTLALTLKVTAGPRTLQETIEKGVQGQLGTRRHLSSGVWTTRTHPPDTPTGHTHRTHSPDTHTGAPWGTLFLTLGPFPLPTRSPDRLCFPNPQGGALIRPQIPPTARQ